MDAIIQKLIEEGGKSLLMNSIKACIEKVARRKKNRLTKEEKKGIEKTAEKMIQAATLEDVHRYSPTVRRIDHIVTYGSAGKKRAPAHKKAAAKRTLENKAVGKRVSVKKSAAKASSSKRAR